MLLRSYDLLKEALKGIWAVLVSIFILGSLGFSQNAFSAVFIDSFDIFGQDDFPTGLAFSADGTKMFVVGTLSTDVNEYVCGSAFDVSTCGFTDAFDVSGQDTFPVGVAFSANGLKMFVVGDDGDDVNEYACGAAFDVSTCAFTDSFSVAAQDTSPTGVAFSADGLTMFVVGNAGVDVNEYACTSAFDVSTCAFTDSFSVAAQETDPTGVTFSADGLTMFVIGEDSDAVHEYALGIAFDVSSVPVLVGGTSIPINTTSLLLAEVQSISMWMIPVLAGIAIGVFVISRRN